VPAASCPRDLAGAAAPQAPVGGRPSAAWNTCPALFERFTERARQVVVVAQEEARGLRHNYIGTEHLLLGLASDQEGLAGRVLASFDITVERVRDQVVRIVGGGEEVPEGQVPFTPRSKKVLALALEEALSLGHNYIDTEHMLLGIVRENEGVAARILRDFDTDPAKVRNAVIQMLSGGGAPPGGVPRPAKWSVRSQLPSQPNDFGWLDGLDAVINQLAEEIRRELGREPDAGDLLLVLASAPRTLASRALQALGIDLDELWGQIERIRRQLAQEQAELERQIEEVRVAKERALEDQQFDAAARLRDQERALTEQQRVRTVASTEALQAIRRRLGLPNPPDS